ncbi:DNA mismatch repair endonuclease MutL [Phormidesmis priestleyi ULC007]|uniref:DNA mismatch repair protein MutL n=1 Tax=Phormidesmis priestleyi ULC007 TaxID=1920490 RepID=A0A2T1DHD4_9CYAN|nr:DNA mismatch repair endonuclease MutL [Phormidesmis priestleyi]PSB19920.1 DNA mismatch repair endonuclease MutL [Phormidesmis priestleyi ULC007]PZO50382.1 MAG: DNA mismatch repair endonuclease MutL [Phormidesmis priestleyi]
MGFNIQPLPTEVVHLIAAGEVIDSLAAVVRELVENSIDAGATRITVSLWADQWRVRVADNGAGMDLDTLKQAALPHTTSKIHDRQDLWNIRSLGFRGEALHSLSQLSQLEILSRSATATQGWRLLYNAEGESIQVETAAIAPGTIVTVDHLFGNWSARRQGLPAIAQQIRSVQSMIQQIALSHPHVTWQVQQNDREWFNVWAGETARKILPQILRGVQIGDLQETTLEVPTPEETDSSSSVYVLLGLPDRCHRHRPDWVRVAINGRFVDIPELEQTILGAFRKTLPRERHPVCVVHLQVPPAHIDWNRHPAKAEIYLHHLSHWQLHVTQAIEQTLRLKPESLSENLYSERVGNLLKTAESEGGYTVNREIQPVQPEASTPASLSLVRAIAQVHNRYILAEHPAGMWLVEQHIAHERVLYEQVCDRWQLAPLEPAIILNHLSTAQLEQLERLGLDVEPFGEQLWAIRTVPAMLVDRDDCAEALIELSLGGDLQSAQVATACRSAIRNGTPLSLTEMQTLLDQWQQTRNPRTCPHGRPIHLSLEETSLARFFRRHWVIGKSHGLEK